MTGDSLNTQVFLMNFIKNFTSGNIFLDFVLTSIVSLFIIQIMNNLSYRIIMDNIKKIYSYVKNQQIVSFEIISVITNKGEQYLYNTHNNKLIFDAIMMRIDNMNYEGNHHTCHVSDSKIGTKTNYETVRSQRIVTYPSQCHSIEIGNGITFKWTKNIASDSEHHKITISVQLNSNNKENILCFLNECKQQYIDYNHSIVKNKLYYYNHIIDKKKYISIQFDRSVYEPTKTFDHIFFPEKDTVIEHLNKFKNDQMQSRAVFLLHGPPGTGKTSLIKAISKYLHKNIFYIKLSEINNYKDLFYVFFNENIFIRDNNIAEYVPVKDRIFVLEDIDVETNIVCTRESSDAEIKSDKASAEENEKNRLNLSDVLQIFDGIFQPEKFAAVITTNRVDKLDDAFIRPGRITFNIHMGNITKHCACQMIKSYYPEMDDDELNFIKSDCISPSFLENLCMYSSSYKELIQKLKSYFESG